MARNVMISCVGPESLRLEPGVGLDSAARAVRRHLAEHVEAVLPEEPDLIVLPEACDRPDSLSIEERKEYYRQVGSANLDYLRRVARTIAEILEEFGLELLDEYLARSLAHHGNPANREP